jgi:hypothetical protein
LWSYPKADIAISNFCGFREAVHPREITRADIVVAIIRLVYWGARLIAEHITWPAKKSKPVKTRVDPRPDNFRPCCPASGTWSLISQPKSALRVGIVFAHNPVWIRRLLEERQSQA